MANSLVGGLISQQYPADYITVTDPDQQKLQQLQQAYGIKTTTDNKSAISDADIIILAVKPQLMQQVCLPLAKHIHPSALIISIAAGIRSTDIDRWLDGNRAIVRCMPNTPSLIQAGATGLYANQQCSEQQTQLANTILQAAGLTLWVEEEALLDAVTAVSGSGPAYFFLLMEAMQQAGVSLGLSEQSASLLARQTALGAAQMAMQGEDEPATLRAKVTSKGGTTAAAIASFENNQFQNIVEQALTAARDRAIELADELGKDQVNKS